MLERGWVGRRVSVRRVVGRADDGRPLHGDVVGELAGLDARTAVIEGRDGPVEVALDTVALARLVPPSTADELALMANAARTLRPAETEPLGGWTLRADSGFTDRANSVLTVGQPGLPVAAAVARAHEWYAARGLPLKIQVPYEARRLLDAALAEQGLAAGPPVHVMTARLAQTDTAAPTEVPVGDAPDDAWLALYRGGNGLSETGRALLTRHDWAGYAALRRDGRTVAVGRGTVDDGWLGVMAVEVDPEYRRQGLARQVMAALHRWGRERGATRAQLQVFAGNAAAVTLYEQLGYWVHHDYHYREQP